MYWPFQVTRSNGELNLCKAQKLASSGRKYSNCQPPQWFKVSAILKEIIALTPQGVLAFMFGKKDDLGLDRDIQLLIAFMLLFEFHFPPS